MRGRVNICMAFLKRHKYPTWLQIRNLKAIKRLMSLNGDILIRSFALLLAFAYFTAQGAKFGDVTLAANAVLLHFFFVGGYFLDDLAVAAEQICGRAIGARDKKAFIRATKLTIIWSITLSIILAVIFLITGKQAIELITTSDEVRTQAEVYFYWSAMISVVGVTAFVMDGIYIGATWSREMSVTMVISLLGFIGIWNFVQQSLGNEGLWLAFYSFLLLRGLTMSLRLSRNISKSFA